MLHTNITYDLIQRSLLVVYTYVIVSLVHTYKQEYKRIVLNSIAIFSTIFVALKIFSKKKKQNNKSKALIQYTQVSHAAL